MKPLYRKRNQKAAGHPADSARFGLSQHRTRPRALRRARVTKFAPAPDNEHSHYHADTGRGSPRTDLETRSSVTVAGFAETAFTARFVNSTFRRAYVYSPGTRLAVDFHEKAAMGSPTARGCCEGPGFPHEAAMPRTSVGYPEGARATKRNAHSAVVVAYHSTHPVSNRNMAVWVLTVR